MLLTDSKNSFYDSFLRGRFEETSFTRGAKLEIFFKLIFFACDTKYYLFFEKKKWKNSILKRY